MPSSEHHPAASRPVDAHEAAGLAELMAAFATASRVRLLYGLYGVERTVEELAAECELAPSVVSQQLRVLRLFRLVKGRRDGRHVRYRLHDDHVGELLAAIRHHGEHATGTVADGEPSRRSASGAPAVNE
ncbi:MAG TPA: metalloregulator ArsR/SmtB family transcription factor [Acidimicrobiales bacterium]|nr:metalloregulator ArsR/SmtB family transcription factor [Acidimicrobiales bacterium]